jgi:hypothetical protein
MPERSTAAHARPMAEAGSADQPPPDVADFIRFCYRRRAAGWPDLYDVMCAVAARREFNGWDFDELEARGLTFSLFEMPRLAAWVRATLPATSEGLELRAAQAASA